jgi:hypothetical protein
VKLNTLIREVLYEEKNKELKIFYKSDIFIQKFKEDKEPEAGVRKEQTKAPTETAGVPGALPGVAPAMQPGAPTGPTPPPAPAESTEEKKEDLLTEEIYKLKAKGEILVGEDEVENIQTLQDLLDFIQDISKQGKNKILDDAAIEIILALADPSLGTPLEKVISKGDKVIVDIDYGTEKEDSIGFKVNKRAGSDAVTMSMKVDTKIIPGEFDVKIFNQQLILFRNRAIK